MKNKKYNGFTLIELMIVVAIIGILSSIALPAYQNFIARSQIVEAIALMNTQKSNIIEIVTNDGVLTNADNGSNGIPAAVNISGKYTSNVSIINGVMVATMNATGVSNGIKSKKLTMTPTVDITTGIVRWKCGQTGDVDNKYLPKACRY